jgi:hypothetical protein
MLVCNVSLLNRRATILAGIVEATQALDAPGTGNVVFATLVDDPASVREIVDAYLGEIMKEAASATATVSAGVVYRVNIDEAATALDASRLPMIWSAAVAEAASAAASQDTGAVAVGKPTALSASRAGAGSAVVTSATGKTQIIPGIGAVN